MDSHDPVPQRIGDAERDFAVQQLQEHHSQGRLDASEFEERMTLALQAKTAPELARLFRDLPGPNPGAPTPVPSPLPPQGFAPTFVPHPPVPNQAPPTPWYAQWWMILVAVGITASTGGRMGMIVPMMAIWLWIVYPSIAANRNRQAAAGQGRRILTEWERQQVIGELGRGRKIHAVKLYREFTGVGLKEAKDDVEAMQRQIEGRGY
ncbi:ribosomal protein L7/L12 [Tessaracoccus sp. OS52]|uniref:ribosomal protein L7/L12 n=1 Tax=Tessaracoccus sp. OS52 TaxID=2886691 RepID=UPI001D106F11|nr:ribosomal protein L7/L12 [Tessaracoccus sp. OS52]MCC2592921.1 ribosomal protein L7/L12 [Tessaracoccus sp. OS52]